MNLKRLETSKPLGSNSANNSTIDISNESWGFNEDFTVAIYSFPNTSRYFYLFM
jgi:hypothetical protein